jgi:biopolymer transport protein ExbD
VLRTLPRLALALALGACVSDREAPASTRAVAEDCNPRLDPRCPSDLALGDLVPPPSPRDCDWRTDPSCPGPRVADPAPEAPPSPAPAERGPTLALSIDGEGEVRVDGGPPLDEDALRALVRGLPGGEEAPRAVLTVDREIPHLRVARVIGILREEGLSRFSIGSREPEPEREAAE